ncbi:RNA polymerase sigma-70 factor [Xanthocytophaga flava]|uniref:RNA polymerase sigma-70 factor n=1 Tax=Xanthocytophaga flava TaxID=3048013 RepID=UPI0028D0D030|nr:RNA polymerase sigma-70 factor [Xanthocytophaga flavus]MDJ1471290.1 RNA polymerase sigma-70 factor [Xanthocytophaga flavus]
MRNFTDAYLLEKLCQNDTTAFEEIYRRYSSKVYRIAYKKLYSKETAEELVQDLFTKLWLKRHELHITGSIESYLAIAILNAVTTHIRACLVREKYASQIQWDHYLQETNTEDIVCVNELEEALQRAISSMPEKSKEVFLLSRNESQSANQIAEHLNISHKTVEYHMGKALKYLRVYLRDFVTLIIFWFTF